MAVRRTLQVGEPLLRFKAKRVAKIRSRAVTQVVRDLVDTMREHELVGISAPQIGTSMRIFVTEIRKTKTRPDADIDELRVFINPKIVAYGKSKQYGWEGCGSVADGTLFAKVMRPTSVVVEAFDNDGMKFTLRANNLLSRVIQHEYDHLEGVLFTDLADIKTLANREQYLKLKARRSV